MMKKFLYMSSLLLFPLLEIAITIFLTKGLGAGWTFLLFTIPAVIGLLIQKRQYKRVMALHKTLAEEVMAEKEGETSRKKGKLNKEQRACCLEVWLYWLIVILLFIPGLLSHILAFTLMVPAVQQGIFAWLEAESKTYQANRRKQRRYR